jgi:hypothetical protein
MILTLVFDITNKKERQAERERMKEGEIRLKEKETEDKGG